MDSIILAGDRENYRRIDVHPNKAFLTVAGRAILDIMLAELAQVEEIDRVIVVGPLSSLASHLPEPRRSAYAKTLILVEQGLDLVSNVLIAFEATAAGTPPDRFALVLPADIPLITAEETRQFISLADMDRYDYVGGLTTDKALARFYPSDDKPGVRLSYFHCQGRSYRINNMHLVRPLAIERMQYIRKTYSIRYQKKLANIFRMLGHLTGALVRAPVGLLFYLAVQLARGLRRMGMTRLSRRVDRRLDLSVAERAISRILGARFKLAVTDYGGAAIDVDNQQDYEAVQARFHEWVAMQKELPLPSSRGGGCDGDN